jgi:hypothetical protein
MASRARVQGKCSAPAGHEPFSSPRESNSEAWYEQRLIIYGAQVRREFTGINVEGGNLNGYLRLTKYEVALKKLNDANRRQYGVRVEIRGRARFD